MWLAYAPFKKNKKKKEKNAWHDVPAKPKKAQGRPAALV
jgi:hypothetical protein